MTLDTIKEKSKELFYKINTEEFLKAINNNNLPDEKLVIDPRLQADDNWIDYEICNKRIIEVCKVVYVERVKKSDKLLHLIIETAHGLRNVVTNIGSNFAPEELISNNYPFTVNLTPFKMMGIESQAMISCASYNEDVILLPMNNLPIGTIIS